MENLNDFLKFGGEIQDLIEKRAEDKEAALNNNENSNFIFEYFRFDENKIECYLIDRSNYEDEYSFEYLTFDELRMSDKDWKHYVKDLREKRIRERSERLKVIEILNKKRKEEEYLKLKKELGYE